MTRKTYRKLADELGKLMADDPYRSTQTWLYIHAFCDAMKADNSAFDRDKFIEAVTVSLVLTQKRHDDEALQALTNSIVAGNG